MSNRNSEPASSGRESRVVSPSERPTGLRYSLVNGIVMEDIIIGEFAHSRKRILALSSPDEKQIDKREKLAAKGIILGTLIHERKQGISYYSIPLSSRPVAHDAVSSARGKYTYGDAELFQDIGKLFADISVICDGDVISDPVENSLALVEFTRPGDRHLYAVPGIEQWLQPLPIGMDALSYYAHYYLRGADLSNMSHDAIKNFHIGYSKGLSEEI